MVFSAHKISKNVRNLTWWIAASNWLPTSDSYPLYFSNHINYVFVLRPCKIIPIAIPLLPRARIPNPELSLSNLATPYLKHPCAASTQQRMLQVALECLIARSLTKNVLTIALIFKESVASGWVLPYAQIDHLVDSHLNRVILIFITRWLEHCQLSRRGRLNHLCKLVHWQS